MSLPAQRGYESAVTAAALRAPARFCRRLRALVLRWQIWETEHYLLDCEREGLTDSLSLRAFRHEVAAMRCRLIDLEISQ